MGFKNFYKMFFKVVLLSILIGFAYGQDGCQDHQKCVHKAQCGADGKVNRDGVGLLIIR